MDDILITIALIAMSLVGGYASFSNAQRGKEITSLKYEVKLLERELANCRDPDAVRKEMENIEKMIIQSLRNVYGNGDNDG